MKIIASGLLRSRKKITSAFFILMRKKIKKCKKKKKKKWQISSLKKIIKIWKENNSLKKIRESLVKMTSADINFFFVEEIYFY